MVTSALVSRALSLATARRTYVPGSAKCAVVTAWPPATAIGPGGSNVTRAGPRYSNHVTDSPPLGRSAAEFVCALGIAPARGGGAARGFGRPSSSMNAANETGFDTLAGGTGAILT